ncbi:phosphoribosylglycinamide formyltransferase [Desulfonema ishimotonii]|uniref:Phosphoribosylglycinamide formyltransferase n=1 Tax=Desulfonema ishimotonii TaxID=45657 RepID=A0A401FRV4_9BACT|nr:phosphoribosylglycinamide formyltransferase [Desulfonema ishimotonii]GBC59702.1 phosphoribosylglycinamide formyltransferase [Desulfonema ishimotonii]
MGKKIRIGALISGGGTNLQAIIDACEAGEIDGEMVFVGSDSPGAYGLERAEKYGIPTFTVDYKAIIRAGGTPEGLTLPDDFDIGKAAAQQSLFTSEKDSARVRAFLSTRAAAEAGLLEAMAPYPFDLLVLAGFMRNLTPYFIDRVNTDPDRPRIMNIHPALLPAFPGVDGYGDTFRYGCKVGGCTVHFIDYGEDSGPIIGQKVFAIEEGDTLEQVKVKGLSLEWALYPECIRLFARNRLKVVRTAHVLENGKTMVRAVVKILPKGVAV